MKWTQVFMEASVRQGGFSDFLMACGINSEKFFNHIVCYCFNDEQPDEVEPFVDKVITYLKEATGPHSFKISKQRRELTDSDRSKALESASKIVDEVFTVCSWFELSDLDVEFIRGQAVAYLRLTKAKRNANYKAEA